MFKCRYCFFENMPILSPTSTPEPDNDQTLLALSKSRDAVTVNNGEAICEVHLTQKVS